jgi:hypothetical protein
MALMRRQSLVKFDAPLCETIVETPKPQGKEVLVRIERCGLCHSDLHIQDGYADLGGGKKLDVGSEEAPIEGLASVRRSNGTCSFPAFRFHEWLREIRREGISETRLTSLNSPRSRLVG